MRPRDTNAKKAKTNILSLPVLAMSLALLGLASCLGGPAPKPSPQEPQAEIKTPNLAAMISAKDTSGIKDLYKNRELLDTPDAEGFYPLHRAVQQDAPDVVDLLAALGARLESTDARGRTPLRLAIDEGKSAPAKILADRGASIFARDSNGTSLAAVALAKGGAIFAAVFNAKTVTQRAQDGSTALHLAADALLEDAVRKTRRPRRR